MIIALSISAQVIHVPTASLTEEEGLSAKSKEFTLENGLKVYLYPNSNMPDVMGSVVVKGGASFDPLDAEGTAHYFEHMMFKGSENLGTIDYKAEKVYLDSIRDTYDLLLLAKDDPVFRQGLLKKIDRLSQIASTYAIPNEFDRVMASIGSTQLNAYTTYENIVYHNHFPAESMKQWLMIQVDRFSHPVFRLFQSELETVYEEKNMSMDNTFRVMFEEVYKNFYPNSVYGKQTVLGSIESLKTPSISKMESYFKDYYVANNMAIILVGNFQVEDVLSELNATFGKLRTNRFAPKDIPNELAFDGRVVVKKKMSPIPIGLLGYRTVPKGDKDELVLEIINQLLTNEQSTGLLDELSLNNDLMFVQVVSDLHYDKGASFIAYAPKPIIQSLKNGENLILAQLEKLKQGDFSNDLLKAVIVQKQKDFQRSMEGSNFQTGIIIDAYMSNQEADKLFHDYSQLNKIDKRTIQAVANKYYGDNYMLFLSKMGFPKKSKIEKPKITPIKPMNLNEQSVLAKRISGMNTATIKPKFIDFNRDVKHADIFEGLHFYQTNNPINNIYSFQLKIGVGTYAKKELELASSYLNRVGTSKAKFKQFRTALQLSGTEISSDVDESYFYINMTGFDKNIESDIRALKQLLTQTETNEVVLKKIVKELALDYKMLKSDISLQSLVLHEYAVYGDESNYLTKLSKKEMKKIAVDDILASIKSLLTYETEIHYVGRTSGDKVKSTIEMANIFATSLTRTASPVYRELPAITANNIYFLNNKKAVQSHIKITIPSIKADMDDRMYVNAFNKYFGLGMSSMAFREIREYRSLAYGVHAYLNVPFNFLNNSKLDAAMTTQGDKTNEAIMIFTHFLDSMPSQDKSIETFKHSLLLSFNSKAPSFRTRSKYVAYWMRQGYSSDPRIEESRRIAELKMLDLKGFHSKFVLNRPYILSVVGDSKRINMEQFKTNLGNYTLLKFKNIYKK